MDVGGLQDSAASSVRPERAQQDERAQQEQRTEQVRAQEQAQASRPQEQAREEREVRISREARELNERARSDQSRERRQEQLRSEERTAERPAVRPSVIAVRLGPGPSPLQQQQRRLDPEDVVRQALNERSLLPRLDGLLDPASADAPAPPALLGQGGPEDAGTRAAEASAPGRVPLPGQRDAPAVQGSEPESAPAGSTAEDFASRDAGARDRAAAELRERAEEPSVDPLTGSEDMERATAVAPQVGFSTGAEDARRPELLGAEREARREDGRASARDALTSSGEVEASGRDELVTRFLGSHQGEERESEDDRQSEERSVGLGESEDDEEQV